jgi:hypothetical protein
LDDEAERSEGSTELGYGWSGRVEWRRAGGKVAASSRGVESALGSEGAIAALRQAGASRGGTMERGRRHRFLRKKLG